MLVEPVPKPLCGRDGLADAVGDARRFAAREALGAEVVDAAGEAVLHDGAKELHYHDGLVCVSRDMETRCLGVATYADELPDLEGLHALLELALLDGCEAVWGTNVSMWA